MCKADDEVKLLYLKWQEYLELDEVDTHQALTKMLALELIKEREEKEFYKKQINYYERNHVIHINA